MNLEQAKELVANRRRLVHDEASIAGLNTDDKKYKHLFNAIDCYAEAIADLRSHQDVQERTTAAAEACNRYISEKRL